MTPTRGLGTGRERGKVAGRKWGPASPQGHRLFRVSRHKEAAPHRSSIGAPHVGSARFLPISWRLCCFFEHSVDWTWKCLPTMYRLRNKPWSSSPLVSSPRCLSLGVFCRFLNYFSDDYCTQGVWAHCLVALQVFSRSLRQHVCDIVVVLN